MSRTDAILLADITRAFEQTQVLAANISTARWLTYPDENSRRNFEREQQHRSRGDEHAHRVPLLRCAAHFPRSTSRIVSISRSRSASRRLRRAFSASSSRRRLTSEVVISP